MTVQISLGNEDRLSQLYSYPNSPNCPWTIAETVKHWFDMTLDRDGLAAQCARCSVRMDGDNYVLELDGPDSVRTQLQQYGGKLTQFLNNGWDALTTTIPKIKADGRWDPHPDPGTYHPWRFFLPHGMAMLNQKAVLFFHYPPIRLLDTNQDYLDDPVPVRCEELLTANGVFDADLPLFNTVMDATPIGAEDDQGSWKPKPGDPWPKGCGPDWGLIPIQDFHDYQKAQVQLLLNTSAKDSGFTDPIVVYGAHPLATFNELYGTNFKTNEVGFATVIPGKKTPVMASTHPYVFYGTAQGFGNIGSGKLLYVEPATTQMIMDLVVARWLKLMSDDPTQDPQAVLKSCQSYWNDSAQSATVSALVLHQGSLKYSNLNTLTFEFLVPLPTIGQTAVLPPAPATARPLATGTARPLATGTAPPLATGTARPLATGTARPSATGTARPLAAGTTAVASDTTAKTLTVVGDSGKPVDWWFIYKVSRESQTTDRSKPTGTEYVYFDSEMAAIAGSKSVLSKNRIDQSGALFDTFSPLFSDPVKSNPNIGWYCYNDESQVVTRNSGEKSGTGPEDRGHCKGALAFDLAGDRAFWLIHSVPLFPLHPAFEYPPTGLKMAQTMLCIQLDKADTARQIAQLMYDAHGPNVNVVSTIPSALAGDDPRVRLMKNLNGSMGAKPTPYSGRMAFNSLGGQKFLAIAKNKAWGNKVDDPNGVKDFYDDLVGPALNENIEVETWENAGNRIPPEVENGEAHKVENMQSVNFANLSPSIPYSWSEKVDHAKLAISTKDNPDDAPKWVCVGDINFTDSMEQRGGGTVAFVCEPLWSSLVQVLSNQPGPNTTSTRTKPPSQPNPEPKPKPGPKPNTASTRTKPPGKAKTPSSTKAALKKPVTTAKKQNNQKAKAGGKRKGKSG